MQILFVIMSEKIVSKFIIQNLNPIFKQLFDNWNSFVIYSQLFVIFHYVCYEIIYC